MESKVKKYVPVVSLISVGLGILFVSLIANGKNVFAYEYEQSAGKIGVWVCLALSAVYPLIAPRLNFTKNDNGNVAIAVLIWGALVFLSFMFAGYISTEFNNPYL
jgi:hypothetical protein